MTAAGMTLKATNNKEKNANPSPIFNPVHPAVIDAYTSSVLKSIDGYRAVDGVTFRVERGQVVGLLGPNGAGKTTTLRVLMGLIAASEGQIRVFGELIVPGASVLAA